MSVMNRLLGLALLGLAVLGMPAALAAPANPAFCVPQGYRVAFFNGVWNDPEDAAQSMLALRQLLGSSFRQESLKYRVMYNQSQAGVMRMQDLAETFIQRAHGLDGSGALESRFELLEEALQGGETPMAAALDTHIPGVLSMIRDLREQLKLKQLADLSALLSHPPTAADVQRHRSFLEDEVRQGRKLLLVAHSQGNLFLTPAFDAVAPQTESGLIQAYHVAPATRPDQLRGPWILADIDLIINALRAQGFSSVPDVNWLTVPSLRDWSGHQWVPTYLDPGRGGPALIKAELIKALSTMADRAEQIRATCPARWVFDPPALLAVPSVKPAWIAKDHVQGVDAVGQVVPPPEVMSFLTLDPSVAVVEDALAGSLRFVAPGTTTLRAIQASTGVSGELPVKVVDGSLRVDYELLGDTSIDAWLVDPASGAAVDLAYGIAWSTDDPLVVSVDPDAQKRAVSEGASVPRIRLTPGWPGIATISARNEATGRISSVQLTRGGFLKLSAPLDVTGSFSVRNGCSGSNRFSGTVSVMIASGGVGDARYALNFTGTETNTSSCANYSNAAGDQITLTRSGGGVLRGDATHSFACVSGCRGGSSRTVAELFIDPVTRTISGTLSWRTTTDTGVEIVQGPFKIMVAVTP